MTDKGKGTSDLAKGITLKAEEQSESDLNRCIRMLTWGAVRERSKQEIKPEVLRRLQEAIYNKMR